MRSRGKARTLNELLLYVQRELEQRKAVDERLAQLPRCAYPFGRLRSDLQKLRRAAGGAGQSRRAGSCLRGGHA